MTKQNRPVLNLSRTSIERQLDLLSLGLLLAMMLASIWTFSHLPEEIPIHWNPAGEVDGYGSRYWIFLIPILSILFHVGLLQLCDYPHTFNYLVEITSDNAAEEYIKGRKVIRWVNVFSQLIFTIIIVVMIRGASGESSSLGKWFVPTILLLSFLPLIYAIWDKNKRSGIT